MFIYDNKIVHFGAKNMSDFTKHKDPERRKRYYARHYEIPVSKLTNEKIQQIRAKAKKNIQMGNPTARDLSSYYLW